ncbi:hypothetical protein WR25_12668 [Diploscapter pachys]|uniref:F-box domain-containing protein n=1 Tax=Diploscapter pachys TaxID=2018661 RepID=A0A2A2KGI6_9BILA|nr:hypothetical protein WR25_12668 [Diploscapter pachys]
MILDGLPLELMREVLLDLPTVDIIQTVKCTRRLHHFAKVDKALGRRLQNRVSELDLHLSHYVACADCGNRPLGLRLYASFRQADGATQWNINRSEFEVKDRCKCRYIDDRTQEIEPGLLDHPSFLYDNYLLRGFENGINFFINNDSLDEAIVNCGKLFNILTKFCVVRKLSLYLGNNDDHMWDKMSAFFNANPPDVRVQPHVDTDTRINLDDFLTGSIFSNGLAEIMILNEFTSTLTNAYHEVFRRTPDVSFVGMDLPYTYEDLFGFFKDTKKLSLHSTTHITKQEICQLVQHFYEVKHDEECMIEIDLNEDPLVEDILTLIPKEAYKLHLKRNPVLDSEPKVMSWAEMTDRFGGTWAIMDMVSFCDEEMDESFLRICSMKYFIEENMNELSDQSDSNQSDSDQSGSDQSDFDQFDSDQFDSDQSDSD